MRRFLSLIAAAAGLACGGGDRSAADSGVASTRSGGVDLTGAGATFPYPLYDKWFDEYGAATGVQINYQSIGSGGGIQQLSAGTVDFGATDGPMTDDEMARATGGPILHFPSVLGGVVVGYHLPDVSQQLRFTPELIADIFLGKVTRWNDPKVAAANPGVSLPATDLIPVHRSDGSGTTYVFTDYLTAVSPAWAQGPGRGKQVAWPVGLGGKGNEQVAGTVKQTPGAIGYMELAYARQNAIPIGLVRNASGAFVQPSAESITAAAESGREQLGPDTDYRVSIVNAPGPNAYPISSFTWLLVYERQRDTGKARKLVDFMRWMYQSGQQMAASLDYAPLPESLIQRLNERLSRIQVGSSP
jgi:phosphate transport system substrate-binding protein